MSGAPARGAPDVRTRRLALGAVALAGVLWGGSFWLGKLALVELTPTWLIAWRFALAALALAPWVPWRRLRVGRVEAAQIVGGGALAGLVVFVLQFEGLDRTTASSAALLVAVAPPLLALGGAWVDGERIGRATWLAIALSGLGVALLVGTPGPGRTLLGDALCAASMVGAVAWTLVSRRLARRVGALAATALQFAAGLGFVVALGLVQGGGAVPTSAVGWTAILALGLVCTAATFFLFTWGVLHVEAGRAGVMANLEPAVGALLGVGLLGEALGPGALAGGALLIAAALLATREASGGEATG